MDFTWLDAIPDHEWRQSHGGGLDREFHEKEIREKSGVRHDEEWRGNFDEWAAKQPRKYSQTPCPSGDFGTKVLITARIVTGFEVEPANRG